MGGGTAEFGDGGLSRVAVISTRPDGTIKSFSPAAERLLGVTAGTVVGRVTPATFHDPVELEARRSALAAQIGKMLEKPFDVIVALVNFGLVATLVLSPLLVPLRAASPAQIHGLAEAATEAVVPAVPAVPAERVILVRVPSDLVMLYGRARRDLQARPFPGSLQYLYAGLDALTITRTDERTLELTSAAGWLYAPLDRLYRDPLVDPFHAGQQVQREGMVIEVLAVSDDGAPTRARVRFDRPLERLAWYTWEGRVPRPFALPGPGESRTSPAQTNPMLVPQTTMTPELPLDSTLAPA